MDSEELYNNLYNKSPDQFGKILSSFLDETSDEDIQYYNTFTDLDYFTQIWIIIKEHDLGDLAVKFIKKLMLIKKDDPQKNKFMIGFANNSENTMFNLRFLKKYNKSLPKIILDTYTTPEKKLLFEAHSSHTGTLGGKRNKRNKSKKLKKTKKRITRGRRIRIKIGTRL
jgi:hypothetical protein